MPALDCVTFTKQGRQNVPVKQLRLKNSFLAGVGFLELANAGDFAADLWNNIPLPPYALGAWNMGGWSDQATAFHPFLDRYIFIRLRKCHGLPPGWPLGKCHGLPPGWPMRTGDCL